MTERETTDSWDTLDSLLDFAMDKEQEAVDFYTSLAEGAENPAMSAVFREFAATEKGHKARIRSIKRSGALELSGKKTLNLKIGDYLVDVEPGPNLNYQQALIIAIKREQAAHNLYTDLAGATEDKDIRDGMLSLAEDEAKHKLRFETEYDDYVLKEN